MKITQKISLISLVLIVSLFVTLVGNVKFFTETVAIYPLHDNLAFVVSLFIWLFAFLSIALLLVAYRYSVKPILIFILLASSVVSYFSNNYGTIFDDNMIVNSMETNLAESMDLFSIKLAAYFVMLGVLPSVWVYRVTLQKHSFNAQLWRRLRAIVALIIVFVLVTLAFSKAYTSFARENKQLRLHINPTYFMYAIGKHINNQFESIDTPFVTIGQDATIQRSNKTSKLIIVVAGETARADRFSLNGYKRDTNPLLAQQDVISFEQMSSCGTDTAVSLPCMFSSLTKSDYSHTKGKNMSNVLDILSTAGVEVLWRDNNSSSKSVADRIEYQDYKSNEVNTICDIECRDEGMLPGLQSYIDTRQNKDIMIVLHMMGSHGPAYYKRYTKEFEQFTPVCKTNQLNECTNEQINNAYDNTILYTDYFLAKVIELLKNNQKEYKTAMLYMSDHGESLGEKGLYLHGMPYFMAPKEQTHVSSIMWFDDQFSKEINLQSLQQKSKQAKTHDGLFHTLLGLMSVDTNVYDKKMDYLSYE
ncbi:phosphoethanolamine transferase [Candidatus Thioglobus sp.]|jgi:lipid A ethanolaminephosphotransferase|uniref:phosphoethanolamine transferase n=1 Tax=Candidatus Thioglobus sp. TaxID=2026721 RepID=UPI0017726B04|nr:phosphoethanolamine--lipid A transferase [Candidatus Thioglobus sp.]HIF48187.1 phosphoethanolamine--lipid A transferase [Candidatus Thioglobus sp.]HIL04133.1 phosphoethanolamine--lipid A transferase [Candidatus Thioglobus autotrophicus]